MSQPEAGPASHPAWGSQYSAQEHASASMFHKVNEDSPTPSLEGLPWWWGGMKGGT